MHKAIATGAPFQNVACIKGKTLPLIRNVLLTPSSLFLIWIYIISIHPTNSLHLCFILQQTLPTNPPVLQNAEKKFPDWFEPTKLLGGTANRHPSGASSHYNPSSGPLGSRKTGFWTESDRPIDLSGFPRVLKQSGNFHKITVIIYGFVDFLHVNSWIFWRCDVFGLNVSFFFRCVVVFARFIRYPTYREVMLNKKILISSRRSGHSTSRFVLSSHWCSKGHCKMIIKDHHL